MNAIMGSTCSIDGALSALMAAKESQTRTQVAFAVAAKQLEAHKQLGDAAGELLAAAARLSRSLDTGRAFDAQA